jgi:hypothetical protein
MATLRTDASDRPPPKPAAETARLLTRAVPVSEAEPSDLRLTSFSDLAWAHWRWERQRAEGRIDPDVQREYEQRLIAFQDRYGEILDAYWSIHDASAVALTERRRRSPLHPFGERIPRYHRATEWATRDEPQIATALDHCDMLAVKAGEVLRGSSEMIALRRVLAISSHLLGFVDRTHGRPARRRRRAVANGEVDPHHEQAAARIVCDQGRELHKVEKFYDRAGNKQARIVYFMGMIWGLALLLPLSAAVVAMVRLVDRLDGHTGGWTGVQKLILTIFAGALGAILSVLIRMASDTGKFKLDYEVGRKQVRWLGAYRPWLGAIFGAATYLLLGSELVTTPPKSVDQLLYYGALAFLAGFFERFMKIAPGGVPAPLGPDPEPAAGKPPEP